MQLSFHPVTISDREAMQAAVFQAGRRNSNYTFANILGWQFRYKTEVCLLRDAMVLRFILRGKRAYMVCTAEDDVPEELVRALLADSGGKLTIYGLEDAQLPFLTSRFPVTAKPLRDQLDYIYRRSDLAVLPGGHLQAKRNHIHRFRAGYPDFEYRPLTPDLFDECRQLTAMWQEKKEVKDSLIGERHVMETLFSNWDTLSMEGGSIYADGRMVAFCFGAAVIRDTFDVIAEKADRNIEGAYAIINQQFASHLPEQYTYVNREEDMDIPSLRKAKLSYHPEILLSFNAVHIA